MFNKIKTWFSEGNKKSIEKIQVINDKNKIKIDSYVESFMTSTGISKGSAKGKLFGTNRISRVYPQIKVDYVGGHFEQPEGKEGVEIILIPEGMLLYNFNDIIPYTEIKEIQFKTESEVQRDVTLTRMIAFGVYALAMKKKKKVVTNYLILNCEHGGIKYSMVFAGAGVNMLYKEVFKKVANI